MYWQEWEDQGDEKTDPKCHLLLGLEEADCVLLPTATEMDNILGSLTHNHRFFGGNGGRWL